VMAVTNGIPGSCDYKASGDATDPREQEGIPP
jgi:hypothetical protein